MLKEANLHSYFHAEFPRYVNEKPREAEGEGFEQISTNFLAIFNLHISTPNVWNTHRSSMSRATV